MATKNSNTTKRQAKAKVTRRAAARHNKAAADKTARAISERQRRATGAERQTKKATVAALLGRAEGASIEELMSATGWQPHSVRAALTGLRKARRNSWSHEPASWR